MGKRIVAASSVFIEELLSGNTKPAIQGVPRDIRVRDACWNRRTNSLWIYCESKEWEGPQVGTDIPFLDGLES